MLGWESRWKPGEWLEVQSGQESPEKGSHACCGAAFVGGPQVSCRRWAESPALAICRSERPAPTRERREHPFCPLWSHFWVGEGEGLRGGSRLMVLGPTASLVCDSAVLLPQGCPHQGLGSPSPLTPTHHPSVRTLEVGQGLGRREVRRMVVSFPGQAQLRSLMSPGAASCSLPSHQTEGTGCAAGLWALC